MAKESPTKQQSIEKVKAAHEMKLMDIEGVQGVGIGQQAKADGLAIKVYVDRKTKSLQEKLPKELDGYPVEIEVSGEFQAL
ncbi:MAG TPA: hypothetical protein VGO69_03795 [Pyrinomonadaceae bacterium]|jgi:hypothetical protein|nr:hypothetical protein [Pyrinomonadaceae bacterium]